MLYIENFIASKLGLKPSNVHFTFIYATGLIVQGLYQFCTSPNFKPQYFILYMIIAISSSLMYYKVYDLS